MKKLIMFIAVATMLMFVGTASAETVAGSPWDTTKTVGEAADGIVNSRHNLSSLGEHWQAHTSSGTGQPASGTNVQTTQICLFCHTSHHTASDCGPLSNRECGGTYTAYEDTYKMPMMGTMMHEEPEYASSSLLCLSCHDGTQAVDMLINAPGGGSRTDGTATNMGWIFYDGGNYKGDASLTGRIMLGTDLGDDHPIGMHYPSHTSGVSVYSLRTKTTKMSSISMYNNASSASGTSENYWAVAGFICGDCSIDDLLFGEEGTVECCTCHDPHFKNLTNTDPGAGYGADTIEIDGLFFRRVGGNSNSGVCRTCHAKS